MASSDLKEELNCSICLSVYMDPVMLGCGHNFCRVCIDRVLEVQSASGMFCCPECRQEFAQRPAPQRNIALCNIAQRFLSTWTDPGETGTFCTYCVDSPVPAMKSCLMCDASLCEKHLMVHSKLPEHVLTDPGTSLENRKCSVHKKILEYYCPKDGVCICVSCSLAGEHRGHQVEMLDEACEKKKTTLRKAVQQAVKERSEAEARVLSLKEQKSKVQENAKTISENATTLLRKKLEELERGVLEEISGQQAGISRSLSDQIQQLEIRKNELSAKIQDMEKLCNVTDPLAVLQGSGPYIIPKVSVKSNRFAKLHGDRMLDQTQNLDVNKIHSALHSGLDHAVSEMKSVFPITPTFRHARLTDKVGNLNFKDFLEDDFNH